MEGNLLLLDRTTSCRPWGAGSVWSGLSCRKTAFPTAPSPFSACVIGLPSLLR